MQQNRCEKVAFSGSKKVYEGVSKDGGILKMDIIVKMRSNVKQSRRFAKVAKAGNREHQTAWDKRRKERQRISKEVTNVQAAKTVMMESASKVSDAYGTKLYRSTRKLKN